MHEGNCCLMEKKLRKYTALIGDISTICHLKIRNKKENIVCFSERLEGMSKGDTLMDTHKDLHEEI